MTQFETSLTMHVRSCGIVYNRTQFYILYTHHCLSTKDASKNVVHCEKMSNWESVLLYRN